MSATKPPVKPTLKEVADLARVSLATASKVANGRPDVASETRERVEHAIEELGYDSGRRKLPGESLPSIAFLADMITSPYAMEVLRGAVEMAEELGIDLVVERTHRSTDPAGMQTGAALTRRLLAARRIGAVLLTAGVAGDTSPMVGSRMPMVVIDPLDATSQDVVSVGSTNWLGGRSAAEHLIGLGHSRIAVIAGPAESMSASARLDGFLSTCRSSGVDVPAEWVYRGRYDGADTAEVAAHWLSGPGPAPTAIMCGNDTQAMSVLRAARAAGVGVPDRLSVVGYDDSPLAGWAIPGLTTVRQPLADIGRRAIETVHLAHLGRGPESRHIELATTLVVRETTAPPSLD